MSTARTRLSAIRAIIAMCLALITGFGLYAAPAQAATIELHASIHASTAFPHAHGNASYESDHGTRAFDLHLYGVSGLAGHRLVVRAHGYRVGTMTVTSTGTAHLQRHHGAPACTAGDAVRIRTRSGTLVGSGILRHHHHGMHH